MTVDRPQLMVGIALLCFPRQWLRRGPAHSKRRRRSSPADDRVVDPWKTQEPGDPHVDFRVEFTKFRNYIDLFRSGVGGLAIWGGLDITPALLAEAGAPKSVSHQILWLQCAIAVLGLLFQVMRFERVRISFFPPIFYLAGLSVGMCGASAAAFAFALIWAINSGLGNAQAFMAIYAVMLYVFGGLFVSFLHVPAMVAGVLALLPVLLSLLTKRPLLIFTRRSSRKG